MCWRWRNSLICKLYLIYTDVCDVSALAACPKLRTLDLSYTKVTDVSALTIRPNLQIIRLRLQWTNIKLFSLGAFDV